MGNAKTWVSAALTNEYTCLDGFKEVEGEVKLDVKKRISKVAKVTSNALFFINRLDGGNPAGRKKLAAPWAVDVAAMADAWGFTAVEESLCHIVSFT